VVAVTASAAGTRPWGQQELDAIVGRPFPGGTTTIEPYVSWLVNDVVCAPRTRTEIAHPIFVYLVATGAMGMTWDELFAACGATADDGPMFGEHETEINVPLRIGATYRVAGEFVSAVRKSGRRAGVFDIIGFELRLTEPDTDTVVATCRNSIVFPRSAA